MHRNLLRSIAFGAFLLMVASLPAAAASYTVRPGDTLWLIAQRHGTTVSKIQQASNVWSAWIYPGQTLTIPGSTGNTAGTTSMSSSDHDLLARLIEAEAQGEPYAGMVGVAAVVFNRIEDGRFPKSVSGAVYERGAFESVSNGLIWRRQPSGTAYQAAKDAANGWDPTHGALFFWNPSVPVNPWMWSRPTTTQIGNHLFAR